MKPHTHRGATGPLTNPCELPPAAAATAVSSNPSLTIASLWGSPSLTSPAASRQEPQVRESRGKAHRHARLEQSRKRDLTDLTCIETTIAPRWLRPINLQNPRILINALHSTICTPAANQSPLRRLPPGPGAPCFHARNPSASLPLLPQTSPLQNPPARSVPADGPVRPPNLLIARRIMRWQKEAY